MGDMNRNRQGGNENRPCNFSGGNAGYSGTDLLFASLQHTPVDCSGSGDELLFAAACYMPVDDYCSGNALQFAGW